MSTMRAGTDRAGKHWAAIAVLVALGGLIAISVGIFLLIRALQGGEPAAVIAAADEAQGTTVERGLSYIRDRLSTKNPSSPDVALGVPPDHPFAKVRILGKVTEAASGVGIVGALVRIRPSFGEPKLLGADGEGWLGFVTGPSGAYALKGIPPGSFDIEAASVGFLPQRTQFRKFSAVEDDEGFNFELEKAAVLEGRVVDGQSRGLAGARVALVGPHGMVEPSPAAVTGDDGRFVLDPVSTEELGVYVELAGFASKLETVGASNDPVRKVEIVIKKGLRIEGLVKDGFGPISGAKVRVALTESEEGRVYTGPMHRPDGSQGEERAVFSDGNGRFFLDAAPQSQMVLMAEASGYRNAQQRVYVTDNPEQRVVFTLESGTRFTGKVLKSDGQPAVKAFVQVRSHTAADFGRAITDEQGRFEIGGLGTKGPWTVAIEHHEHPVLEVEEAELGERTYRLEAPARILGWVKDARTLAPITRYDYAVTGPIRTSGGAVSLTGSIEIGELLAGTYTVRVGAEGYLDAVVNNVVVSPGQTTSDFEIRLERGSMVEGRVTGGGMFSVFAVSGDSEQSIAAAVETDEDGTFQLGPLAAGVYTLRVAGESGVSTLDGVQVRAGADVSGLELQPPR